ncbi:MAG: DUF1844 domain-containing protein [Candidatus Eiseniibacteriota bacterium]
METIPQDRNAALMMSLALGLAQAAYQQMGKVKNELTGNIERNLEAARITIDTLAALEQRTRGSRTEEETQIFQRSLTELRLNYVDEVKKSGAPPAPSGEPSAAGPSAAESSTEEGSTPGHRLDEEVGGA